MFMVKKKSWWISTIQLGPDPNRGRACNQSQLKELVVVQTFSQTFFPQEKVQFYLSELTYFSKFLIFLAVFYASAVYNGAIYI